MIDVAASVRARLLNVARAQDVDFNQVLAASVSSVPRSAMTGTMRRSSTSSSALPASSHSRAALLVATRANRLRRRRAELEREKALVPGSAEDQHKQRLVA
jgi:hypothetical protein